MRHGAVLRFNSATSPHSFLAPGPATRTHRHSVLRCDRGEETGTFYFLKQVGNSECPRFCSPGNKRAARDLLAITAVTLEHHDRFGGTFVANRTAHGAAGEGCAYFRHTPHLLSPDSQA